MARFPRTIGDVLAAQAGYARDMASTTLGVAELAPIGMDNLDVDLQNNINVVNDNVATVQQAMADLDQAQADAVSDLLQLNEDLSKLDGRLTVNDAAQAKLVKDLAANDAAQAANSAYLTQLDADLAANKNAVAAEMLTVNQTLSGLDDDLAAIPAKINTAINAANAIPLTNERFTEASLTVWPFVNKTIPKGAFDVGAIAGPDLADFSIFAKKFNDKRHRLY